MAEEQHEKLDMTAHVACWLVVAYVGYNIMYVAGSHNELAITLGFFLLTCFVLVVYLLAKSLCVLVGNISGAGLLS